MPRTAPTVEDDDDKGTGTEDGTGTETEGKEKDEDGKSTNSEIFVLRRQLRKLEKENSSLKREKLSEVDRLKAELKEKEEKATVLLEDRKEVSFQKHASSSGIKDAEYALYLAKKHNLVSFDEDGRVENWNEVKNGLKKIKPNLFESVGSGGQTKPQTKAAGTNDFIRELINKNR